MRYAKWIAVPIVAGMFAAGTAGAATKKQPPQQAPAPAQAAAVKPIGRITATFGAGKIESAGKARAADLHELFNSDDRIVTDGGGLSVLLSTRVVLKIDADTAVRISEGVGQTNVVLERGTVHIFVGRRSADMGLVALQDNNARVEGLNAVYLASYNPDTHESYYACEHDAVRLETKSDAQVTTLEADKQIVIRDGKIVSTGEIDRVAFNDHKQTLDRLGQTTVELGSETFRLRSRTQDTEVAISQLAAAGWIDRQALSSGVSPSTGSGTGTGKPKSKTKSNNTGTATITSRAASSAEAAATDAAAAADAAQTAAASSKTAPPVAPVVPVVTEVVDKVSDKPIASNSGTGSTSEPKTEPVKNETAPPPVPVAVLPTPIDVDIDPVSSNSGKGSLPTIDLDDSSGKGKGNKGKGGDAIVAVPVQPPAADIGLTPPAVPVIPAAPTALIPNVTETVAPPVAVETPVVAPPPVAMTPPIDIAPPPAPVAPPVEIAPPPTTIAPPVAELPTAPTTVVPPPTEIAAPVPPPIEVVLPPAPVDIVPPPTEVIAPLPTVTELTNSGTGSISAGTGSGTTIIPDVETTVTRKHRKGR